MTRAKRDAIFDAGLRYTADIRAAGAKFDQLLAAGRLAAAVRAHSRALRIAGAAHDAAVAAAKETP